MNKKTLISILLVVGIVSFFNLLPGISEVLKFDEQEATVRAIKKVAPSVVNINVSLKGKKLIVVDGVASTTDYISSLGSGTGFIISADGLIITNKHVVDVEAGSDVSYRITMSNGKKQYAMLIGTDPLNDLALLKIFDKNLPFVELGDSNKMPLGSSVIAIGNALGMYQNSVTKGIISGLNRDIVAYDSAGRADSLSNVLQTDAQINLGNSGGPLVDLNGKVVGVNVATDGGGQSIGFAIPINDVKPVIRSARENGYIVRPRLGVQYLTLNQDLVEKYKLGQQQGAWLHSENETPSVLPDTPAAKAGLQDGDIIIAVDRTSLTQQVTLSSLVQNLKPGQKITIKVYRQGKILNILATLDKYPTNK
jgi:serine protease Do